MKLNTRRTMLIGLAFMSICAFWQLYNYVVPLMLRYTFHLHDGTIGIVMAADNVLALFLLPLFGSLSDKTHTKLGRKTPYILGGTVAAAILLVLRWAEFSLTGLYGRCCQKSTRSRKRNRQVMYRYLP